MCRAHAHRAHDRRALTAVQHNQLKEVADDIRLQHDVAETCPTRRTAIDSRVILVDTSTWIDHLRTGEPALATLLQEGHVLGHAWVTGELAMARSFSANNSLGSWPICRRRDQPRRPRS